MTFLDVYEDQDGMIKSFEIEIDNFIILNLNELIRSEYFYNKKIFRRIEKESGCFFDYLKYFKDIKFYIQKGEIFNNVSILVNNHLIHLYSYIHHKDKTFRQIFEMNQARKDFLNNHLYIYKNIYNNDNILKELELDTPKEQAPKKIKKI